MKKYEKGEDYEQIMEKPVVAITIGQVHYPRMFSTAGMGTIIIIRKCHSS